MALEAVIFDWGGTLTPWHIIDPYECWFAVTEDAEQAKALMAAEQAVWELVRHEHRSGTLTDILTAAQLSLSEAQLAAYYRWGMRTPTPTWRCPACSRRCASAA